MRVAADCNNVKACFPVAVPVMYFVVVGTSMTSQGFFDKFWIQMRVRELAGYESILSPRWNLCHRDDR